MSDDEPDLTLTPQERRAIRSLHSLAKRWPRSLTLASMGGTLVVVHTADERFHSDDGVERQEAIVADGFYGIPNDGGDW